MRLAAPIAVKTVVEFIENEWHSFNEVRLVLYTREEDKAYMIFADALQRLLATKASP